MIAEIAGIGKAKSHHGDTEARRKAKNLNHEGQKDTKRIAKIEDLRKIEKWKIKP